MEEVLKYFAMTVLLVIILYIVTRLVSSAIFRSYFQWKKWFATDTKDDKPPTP